MTKRKTVLTSVQLINLKKRCKREGITTSKIDKMISYTENKKQLFGGHKKRATPEMAEIKRQMIHSVSENRTFTAQDTDKGIKADIVLSPKSMKDIKKWSRSPNRIDLKGVDVSIHAKIKRTKRKKRKRKR